VTIAPGGLLRQAAGFAEEGASASDEVDWWWFRLFSYPGFHWVGMAVACWIQCCAGEVADAEGLGRQTQGDDVAMAFTQVPNSRFARKVQSAK
jgi:hypothetical protein